MDAPSPAEPDRGQAPRRRRRLGWQKKLGFSAALLVLTLALLEGGLRALGWPTGRVRSVSKLANLDPESFAAAVGVWTPGARSRVAWPPELAYDVEINALGLRGPEAPPTPAPGTRRVLMLGDSMTFGFYVDQGRTYPEQLERALRAGGVPAEVLNAGCGGWSIPSHTLFLEERGLRLAPHLAVLTFCANDIKDLEQPRPLYEGQKALLGEGKGAATRLLYDTALYELSLRIKVALKHWRERRSGELIDPLTSVDVPAERLDALWSRYAEWLQRLRDALAARGVPLVVVYLPDAYKLEHGLPPDDQERLFAACAALEVPCTSPLPEFTSRPWRELFHLPMDSHLSAAGCELVAEHVGRFLLERREALGLSQ